MSYVYSYWYNVCLWIFFFNQASFQVSAAKLKKTALFWGITQRVGVISYDVSRQPVEPIYKGRESRNLEVYKWDQEFAPKRR